ncbi:MAG: flagellar filament capping protein FliD [Gammaproteobacteria bacterium]
MATITSAGIGTGLDINSIISQLMEIERQPLVKLQNKRSDLNAQLSDYGQLKSALSELQTALGKLNDASDFDLFTADAGNSGIFTATAGSGAAEGNYSIEVQNLAVAHKMGSASFADADTTTVGNSGDTMTITVDGNAFTVGIGGLTLNGIRDAINDASDNVGVTASIIQVDSTTYHLTLTSDNSGTANTMSLSFADSGGGAIADPLTMATTTSAEDARLLIDGTYSVTRSSNSITDAIGGVTLELLAEDPGTTYSLSINSDHDAIKESVQGFVDAYNALHKLMNELGAGSLSGDNSLLTIENGIRSVLNTPYTGGGSYSYLAEVGITVDKNGEMSLDSDELTLSDALANDFQGVVALFSDSTQGYAARLDALMDQYLELGGNGLIESREDGINNRIDLLDTRIDTLERRLVLVEQRYTDRFTALDSLVSQLQVTSNYLTQQLTLLTPNRNN